MTELDKWVNLSEQDYGPWLDAATLFETDDGQLLLQVEGGYGKPYDTAWYSLAERPDKPLDELLKDYELWANPTSDQSEQILDDLGVVAHLVERPD
jgi:hypothetical protein